MRGQLRGGISWTTAQVMLLFGPHHYQAQWQVLGPSKMATRRSGFLELFPLAGTILFSLAVQDLDAQQHLGSPFTDRVRGWTQAGM